MYTYIGIFPRLLSYNMLSWQVSCYIIAPWFNTHPSHNNKGHIVSEFSRMHSFAHMKSELELSLSELSSWFELLIMNFSKHKAGRELKPQHQQTLKSSQETIVVNTDR